MTSLLPKKPPTIARGRSGAISQNTVGIVEFDIYSDAHFMRKAYSLALQAYHEGEVPVGAVVVGHNRIIGSGYNQVERLADITAHAEIMAITAATQFLGAKYLVDCTLYVTLEPCAMCAGALHWAQLGRVVFGARDPKKGFLRYQPPVLLSKVEIVPGIMETECATLLREFFL
ncbi:MAG: nucleoside deaminase [Bacteroidetes bacterium]|nr:nucleoside deaminase [Bacteroidota bacterium]